MQPYSSTISIEKNSTPVFDAPVAYWSLIFLTFIMFIAPMGYFPILIPLRLALVSALLAMTIYLLSVLMHGGRLSIWGPEVKMVLWLVFFAAFSIFFSRWRGGSYELLFDLYLKSVILFFLIANLLTSERRVHGLLWALTLYSTFNALIGINEYRTGSLFQGRIRGAGYSGLTANPNDLALSLNLAIPFIWYLFATSKTQLQKAMTGGALTISIACIIITWSRSGALALLAIFLAFVWKKSGSNRVKRILGVVCLIGIIVVLSPSGYSERIASTADFSKDQTGSAAARWQTTVAGIRQTFEYPFGVGLGMNGVLNHDEGMGWSAGVHNVYLQISTELGIIPGVIFIVLFLRLIKTMKSIRINSEKRRLQALAEATECCLIGFAVEAFFAPVAYNFYFYIVAGIAMAIKEIVVQTTSVSQRTKLPLASMSHASYGWPDFSKTPWIAK